MTDRLIFRAFRAIDDLDFCLKYREGHISVLKDYGITNVTSNNDEWMYNPNIYCIAALSRDETEMLGGIRVQVSDENTPLPVETAIGKMDNRIYAIVSSLRNNGGVGELSGLWNCKKIAGMGVSILLSRAGVSITNQLNISTMIGICAEYTLNMFQRVGFVIDRSLGDNGVFPYPNPTYTANVLGIVNAVTLETAAEYDRERMKSIRDNPTQTFLEQGNKQQIEVQYNLIYKI